MQGKIKGWMRKVTDIFQIDERLEEMIWWFYHQILYHLHAYDNEIETNKSEFHS